MVGVIRSPRALFTSLIARPRWVGVLMVSLALAAGCGIAFMRTAVGRQALVDQWERTALAFGQEVSNERYAEFSRLSEHGAGYAVASALASGPLLTFAMAALILVVFNWRAEARRTYAQVLAIVAHGGLILALRQVVATPLNYSRETLASPTTLSLLFPMFDEASPAARFFGAIDMFVVWWVIVLAIGVSLLYRRPARSTAFAFMGAYIGVAVLLTIAMALSGGTV